MQQPITHIAIHSVKETLVSPVVGTRNMSDRNDNIAFTWGVPIM